MHAWPMLAANRISFGWKLAFAPETTQRQACEKPLHFGMADLEHCPRALLRLALLAPRLCDGKECGRVTIIPQVKDVGERVAGISVGHESPQHQAALQSRMPCLCTERRQCRRAAAGVGLSACTQDGGVSLMTMPGQQASSNLLGREIPADVRDGRADLAMQQQHSMLDLHAYRPACEQSVKPAADARMEC